jgi:1-acyl-sn-glycerol-3-phosphate acyltransferase
MGTFLTQEKEAFIGFHRGAADRFWSGVGAAADLLGVELCGVERIPPGRALLVANHAFGWDVGFGMALIRRTTGRTVFALGEHAWWKVPLVRRWAALVGVVDGTQENADALLAHDELVVVQPGGLREAVKPRELRYRLLWGHRYGFVRAAIRNRAPLVPLVCLGADELFDFVGNAFRRGERLLPHTGIPVPLPRRVLPSRLAKLRYVIGDPIPPPSQDDEATVHRYRREIEGAIHELIEVELGGRLGLV